MWLEQKVYTFQSEKGAVTQEDILDNIYLRVNENLTTVKLKQLFLKNSEPEFDEKKNQLEVKGWSLLEKIDLKTGELKVNEETVKISFNSEELGDLKIIEISNPLIQSNDKELEDEDLKKFNEKIIELSKSKVEDEQGKGVGTPHTEPLSVINKKYENGKIRYLNNGFVEYVDKNYRLLVKKDDEKTIALLFDIISEQEINQLSEPKISEPENYQFIDKKNNKVLEAKIEENKLIVEEQKA